jgi:hypothetical protein
MDGDKKRLTVKYFHLQGWENKKVTTEVDNSFEGSFLSRAIVKR